LYFTLKSLNAINVNAPKPTSITPVHLALRSGLSFFTRMDLLASFVISGDVHANWASNILSDFNDARSKLLGVEFIGTSIASGGNGAYKRADTDKILGLNQHIKFFNDYRGYVRCTVTPEQWRADYRVVPYVTIPGADMTTRASFVYKKCADGLVEVSTAEVAGGRKRSSETEEDRIRAHERAHEIQNGTEKRKAAD